LLKRLFNLLLAMTVVIASLPATPDTLSLPDIGDPSGSVITPDQERELGSGLLRNLRQQGLVLNDPLVDEYINSLGYRLVSNSDGAGQRFTFFIVHSSEINAFAAPGGYIGVNTGLILTTESESELAAVMAHEIAHITQHHMARTYEAAGRYKWATAVAILAAVLLGQHSGQLGEAAAAAGIASNAQLSINFTRANEKEADAIGMQTLDRAGFNPYAMANFFARMQRATRLYGTQLPEFLRTHPVTVSRIAEARNRAAQLPDVHPHSSENYFLIKARLRVLSATDAAKAQERFNRDLKHGNYRNEEAERYGHALALLGNGKYDQARGEIDRLLKKDPERIALLIASARIEMESGHAQRAFKIYQKALLLYPHNHPLTYYYARDLLAAGKADRAMTLLRGYVRNRDPDAGIYHLYAQAAGDSGHLAEAYQNMAEYYFLHGQTSAAIDQLAQASKLKHLDYYQASKIQARLRQLKAIAREEQQ
jgi:predicted Zn-dependent protease